MGAFFDSIHVRTKNSDTVRKALETVAKEADSKFLVGPAVGGWISIFPNDSGQSDPISSKVAKHLSDDIFHLIVHDDDIFFYYFYRNGQLIDRYNSCLDSFEEVSEEEKQQCQGHPELFQDLLRKPESLNKLKTLLAADKFTFESERMTQFVKIFGLSNALSSYDLLQSGDQDEDEIEGGKSFIHLENQPDSAESYNNRGEAKLAKGDLEGAMADFAKAITLNPDLMAARDNLGRVELAKSDRDKEMAETWNEFGRIKKAEGDLDGALLGYNTAIELNPTYAAAYSNRGGVKQKKGDPDGAMADYNKAIELNPNLAAAYNNRGDAKRTKGDLDGSLVDFDKAIQLKPEQAQFYKNRGDTKRVKKDWDGALADYTKATELKPDMVAAYNNRGLVKQVKGNLDDALADFSKAIELKPDDGLIYYNRCVAKKAKGDLDGARIDFNKAIELKPDLAKRANF